MTEIPIKRGRYTIGDHWKDYQDRIWKISRIVDSDLGAVFKLKSNIETISLSIYSMKKFLKLKEG